MEASFPGGNLLAGIDGKRTPASLRIARHFRIWGTAWVLMVLRDVLQHDAVLIRAWWPGEEPLLQVLYATDTVETLGNETWLYMTK